MPAIAEFAVGPQGYGAMGLSHSYGHADDDQSIRTLHRAIDLGANLIDTANIYGAGHNEELVGRAIADRRDRVVLASKFGLRLPSDPEDRRVNGSPAYARVQIEASLKRLKVDQIDLYYLHRVDPLIPIEETVGELVRFKEEGKIRAIGLSEASADVLRRAHSVHPIAALQSEYSLWTRDVEAEILPTAAELGIAFVAFSPLGRGFLAGALPTEPEDRRLNHPRFQPEAVAANSVRRAMIEAVAHRLGATVGQISLAWLLAKAAIPIPGTRQIGHLEANWAANEIVLDAATVGELDDAFPAGTTVGDRSPLAARLRTA